MAVANRRLAAWRRLRTPDTDLKQVAVEYVDDEDFQWHHRLLLERGSPGVWVCANPTMSVQQVDLIQLRVIPLSRHSPYPDALEGNLFHFEDLTVEDLDKLRREGSALASVLGYVQPTAGGDQRGIWVVSDTAHSAFAMPVPEESLSDPDLAVLKGAVGLIFLDDMWVAMQMVPPELLSDWKAQKQSGLGRDVRIGGPVPSSQRYVTEAEAQATWATPSIGGAGSSDKSVEKRLPHSPFHGPAASREFFNQLSLSGLTLIQYDQPWRSKCGAPELGMACRMHTALCDTLRWAITADRLDPTNLVCGEALVREIIKLETAVARSPKQPDWE